MGQTCCPHHRGYSEAKVDSKRSDVLSPMTSSTAFGWPPSAIPQIEDPVPPSPAPLVRASKSAVSLHLAGNELETSLSSSRSISHPAPLIMSSLQVFPSEELSFGGKRRGPEYQDENLSLNSSNGKSDSARMKDDLLQPKIRHGSSGGGSSVSGSVGASPGAKSRRSALGKFSASKESIMSTFTLAGHERFLDEVSGEVELRLSHENNTLSIKVIQARDLKVPKEGKLPNSYVKCYLLPDSRKQTKRKTKPIKDTQNPKYNETLTYEHITRDELMSKELHVAVWHHHTLGHNVHLGENKISLALYDWKNPEDAWYALTPDLTNAGLGLSRTRSQTSLVQSAGPRVALSLKFVSEGKDGKLMCSVNDIADLPLPTGRVGNVFLELNLKPHKKSAKQRSDVFAIQSPMGACSVNQIFTFAPVAHNDLKEKYLEVAIYDQLSPKKELLIGSANFGMEKGSKAKPGTIPRICSGLWEQMSNTPGEWFTGSFPVNAG